MGRREGRVQGVCLLLVQAKVALGGVSSHRWDDPLPVPCTPQGIRTGSPIEKHPPACRALHAISGKFSKMCSMVSCRSASWMIVCLAYQAC